MARHFGDAVRNIIHRVEPRHILLLQEIDGVRLALGKERGENVGARRFAAARRLHMQDGALQDALKAGGRRRVLAGLAGQVIELVFDKAGQVLAQSLDVNAACFEHRHRIQVIAQRQQQMLERGQLMFALAGERQSPMQGFFKFRR